MDQLRDLVVTACRVLADEDQGDLVWGHVSVRDPAGRGVWMKAATWGFEEVTPDRVVLVGWGGEVLEGTGRRHAEYPIHTEILAARPDVNAVVHTHAPHAVVFAATGLPLLPVSHEATLFTPPDVPRFTTTGDLILTPRLGQLVAACLGEHRAAFLVNHGLVVTGEDLQSAVVATILMERACRTQLRVIQAGGASRWSDDAEALAKRDHCYPPALLRQAWEYLARQV